MKTKFVKSKYPKFYNQTILLIFIFLGLKAFSKSIESPVDSFLKTNTTFSLKSNFTEDVKKMLGPKRNPALVKGDFNGDGTTDFVSILSQPKMDYMVFFYSDGKIFQTKYKKIPKLNNTYLTTVPEKQVQSGLPNDKPRDLVQLETYYGPTTAYYIEGSKVLEFKGSLVHQN
jgi:hypothetical protein